MLPPRHHCLILDREAPVSLRMAATMTAVSTTNLTLPILDMASNIATIRSEIAVLWRAVFAVAIGSGAPADCAVLAGAALVAQVRHHWDVGIVDIAGGPALFQQLDQLQRRALAGVVDVRASPETDNLQIVLWKI
jgi:hypothetical protein